MMPSSTAQRKNCLYLPTERIGQPEMRWLVMALLAGCVLFNFALCFINTNIFATSASTAMLSEAVLLGGALLLLSLGPLKNLVTAGWILTSLLAYFFLLYAARSAIDPKPFRDVAIPVIFIMLGRAYPYPETFNRLMQALCALVLAVGLVEYFFAADYTRYFDILKFYIAKGATDASAADFIKDGLNINGQRPLSQGRELLPWLLSGHRASSIFLEPVTAANFGAIAAAWFLTRNQSLLTALPWLIVSAAIIVLSDGRFGFLLYLSAIFFFICRRHLHIGLTSLAPFAIVSFLIFNYVFLGDNTFPNTFSGRLDYAAHLFTKFDVLDLFGLVTHRAYYDSGYAYAVTQFGVLCCILLWLALSITALILAPRSYLVNFFFVYVCLALMTSGSLYSIKASALMWYMIGLIFAPQAATIPGPKLQAPYGRLQIAR